ncbi:hypothetical protein [Aurantiacibacter poecillastricola]|uniref:hypothetical protein n=1 Tax=Aurantiacibacter poecillastricola TaxID=3064385 RepID=UPI00273D33AA|nr:hypothetical protein [Aurantiacibacter sp. 219JJ12-13]MDP5263504.1 hypothetical protein [Aurantiacibacter sp. 219JJ12-13]
MSTATPTPPIEVATDTTRWTGPKAAAFLKALARHGKVAKAAREVGMSRQAAYRLRARAPKFAEMWDWAMREAEARRVEAHAAGRRGPVHPLLARGPVAGQVSGSVSGPRGADGTAQ